MKKKIICTILATTMLLSQTTSAAPWWLGKYRVNFDNELGIVGNVTLTFASDGGSFIRPITKKVRREHQPWKLCPDKIRLHIQRMVY